MFAEVYGLLAMGWRGSARHWKRYETAYLLLAGLATPLVLSVHTVVSFDFAVVDHSRLAHDDLPAILRRRRHLLRLRHGAGAGDSDPAVLRPERHDHRCAISRTAAKVMLATGLIVAYGYIDGSVLRLVQRQRPTRRFMLQNRWFGPYGWSTGC